MRTYAENLYNILEDKKNIYVGLVQLKVFFSSWLLTNSFTNMSKEQATEIMNLFRKTEKSEKPYEYNPNFEFSADEIISMESPGFIEIPVKILPDGSFLFEALSRNPVLEFITKSFLPYNLEYREDFYIKEVGNLNSNFFPILELVFDTKKNNVEEFQKAKEVIDSYFTKNRYFDTNDMYMLSMLQFELLKNKIISPIKTENEQSNFTVNYIKTFDEQIQMIEHFDNFFKTNDIGKKIRDLQSNGIPELLRNLIDSGQVLQVQSATNKYKLASNTKKFIAWCMQNGYGDIEPKFILSNLDSNCSENTIKDYIRRFKKENKEDIF